MYAVITFMESYLLSAWYKYSFKFSFCKGLCMMVIWSVPSVKWNRVVFKVSGTALAGSSQNIDPNVALQIVEEVAAASRCGVQVLISILSLDSLYEKLHINVTHIF